ncbi:MAG: biopolymer transporter ExbD [bacterium]|nr:biopolymer transporter ExbD [bacterium]
MAIKKRKFLASVPMSSMADIAFLLLIFFMVTSVLKVDAEIPLNLPDASGTELGDEDVNVSIGKDGSYWFTNQQMPRDEVIARIQVEVQTNENVRIAIQAHDSLDFTVVQEFLDRMRLAGVKNFAMVTKQENRKL